MSVCKVYLSPTCPWSNLMEKMLALLDVLRPDLQVSSKWIKSRDIQRVSHVPTIVYDAKMFATTDAFDFVLALMASGNCSTCVALEEKIKNLGQRYQAHLNQLQMDLFQSRQQLQQVISSCPPAPPMSMQTAPPFLAQRNTSAYPEVMSDHTPTPNNQPGPNAYLAGGRMQASMVRVKPVLANPALGNPAVGNPAIGNPAIGNPAIGNPAGVPFLGGGQAPTPMATEDNTTPRKHAIEGDNNAPWQVQNRALPKCLQKLQQQYT